MPLHVGKGRNISTAIADIIDYVENPQKTDFGKFVYGYECDTRLADAEFLLSKRQYANLTGRNQGADDVIAYHLRQAFKPGEVTPEEANQIGRELALKLTKGNHAFVVCTHVDSPFSCDKTDGGAADGRGAAAVRPCGDFCTDAGVWKAVVTVYR